MNKRQRNKLYKKASEDYASFLLSSIPFNFESRLEVETNFLGFLKKRESQYLNHCIDKFLELGFSIEQIESCCEGEMKSLVRERNK